MKRTIFILLTKLALMSIPVGVYCQYSGERMFSVSPSKQNPREELLPPGRFAIKTNLLYDATTTFNLGAELRLSQHYSLDIPVSYNPWTFSNNKKIKHLLVQPELRYWLCETFNGHFLGIQTHYSLYNFGNFDNPFSINTKDYRRQGWLLGAGLSYGYQWYLSPHWNLEATVAVGYAYARFKKYDCERCGSLVSREKKHYVGPTKVGLSLVYIIK